MDIKKTIYVDTNVFTYLQHPRTDEKHRESDTLFREIVDKLARNNKYIFPYSQIHIFDLLNSTNEEYLANDLDFISKITQNTIIGENKNTGELSLDKFIPKDVFEYSNSFKPPKIDSSRVYNPNETFGIDLKIPIKNDLYKEYAFKSGGLYEPDTFTRFVDNKFFELMDTPHIYKGIRDDARSLIVDESKLNSKQLEYYRSFKSLMELLLKEKNVETLKNRIIEAIILFMKANHTDYEALPLQERMGIVYAWLDFRPDFSDKIKNNSKNAPTNMIRDGSHLYIAHLSKYYVLEDIRSIKKVKMIYELFGVKTKVVTISEFNSHFL